MRPESPSKSSLVTDVVTCPAGSHAFRFVSQGNYGNSFNSSYHYTGVEVDERRQSLLLIEGAFSLLTMFMAASQPWRRMVRLQSLC